MAKDKPKKMDLDEPVNVEMDPEDALRLLLGEERCPEEASDSETNDLEPGHEVA